MLLRATLAQKKVVVGQLKKYMVYVLFLGFIKVTQGVVNHSYVVQELAGGKSFVV